MFFFVSLAFLFGFFTPPDVCIRYETPSHLWLVLEYCVGGDLMTLLLQVETVYCLLYALLFFNEFLMTLLRQVETV